MTDVPTTGDAAAPAGPAAPAAPAAPDAPPPAPAGHAELVGLVDGCAALSREHAAVGETRAALLAMWACDLHVLQLLLLENGLDQAPDPLAQLAAVGEAVEQSLDAVVVEGASPRALVERSRAALVATFDASVHALLDERFLALDHLDGVPTWAPGADARAAGRRLEGRTPEQLVAELEATAQDCLAVAEAMVAAGDAEGASHQLHHADLASFEAFLLCGALASGDEALASVDLCWDLAAREHDERSTDVPEGADLGTVVGVRRERLAVSGGLAHAARLRASFVPVPPR